MILAPWSVIWPYDREARPPKPKLWVAIAPSRGWFLRINTHQKRGSVCLRQALHPFLWHDSWLHCWGPRVEVDDYALQELMDMQQRADLRGVLGEIDPSVRDAIRISLDRSPELSPNDRRIIFADLGAPNE